MLNSDLNLNLKVTLDFAHPHCCSMLSIVTYPLQRTGAPFEIQDPAGNVKRRTHSHRPPAFRSCA